MTIWVKIGGVQKTLEEARPDWINQTINGYRRDGLPVCVQVQIKAPPLDIIFSSPGCGGGGGGGRPLNNEEIGLLKLWEQHHLNTTEFSGGSLVAFLRKIS